MLRLPSEPIWLGLCPHQVGAVRPRKGQGEPIASLDVAPAQDTVAALLQAVEHLLDAHGIRGARLHAVLSDRLVRYALLRYDAAHLDEHEERALCQARFGEMYGPMPDWLIEVEPARYGRARVACAVPRALVDGLRALCAARALRLGRIVPHFASCWNRQPRAVRRGAGIFAVVEHEMLVLASFDRAGWHSLRAQYANTGAGAVADLVYRERLLQRIDPEAPLWGDSIVGLEPALAALGTVAPPRSPHPGLALALSGPAR